MDANKYLGSSHYLKKEDLDRDHVCRITRVVERDVDDQVRLALGLSNCTKELLLNATNLKRLIRYFGDQTDGWIDQTIEIYVDPDVEMKGQVVGGIRVRECQGKATANPGPAEDSSGERPGADMTTRETWKDYARKLEELDQAGGDISKFELPPNSPHAALMFTIHSIDQEVKRLKQLRQKPEWTARNQRR